MKNFEIHNGSGQGAEATAWDKLGMLDRNESKEVEKGLDDKNVLNSEKAKSVLPYLTLDRLSEHEKTELLELADSAIQRVTSGNLTVSDNIKLGQIIFQFYPTI